MFKRLYFDIPPYYQLNFEEDNNGDYNVYVLSFSKYKKGVTKTMKFSLNKDGYLKTKMTNKNCFLHRLVATYLVPNPNNYNVVNHKDGNKLNNHYSNLEWCTIEENIKHSYETGLHVAHTPEKHGNYIDGRTIGRRDEYKKEWYIKNRDRILLKLKEKNEKSKL